MKSGCSQKPLQFLKRAALSCPIPLVICILTEILDNPNGAFAGTDRLRKSESRSCPLARMVLVGVRTMW